MPRKKKDPLAQQAPKVPKLTPLMMSILSSEHQYINKLHGEKGGTIYTQGPHHRNPRTVEALLRRGYLAPEQNDLGGVPYIYRLNAVKIPPVTQEGNHDPR